MTIRIYECWIPDLGQTRADASLVKAILGSDAAEAHAEDHFNRCAETPHDINVMVADETYERGYAVSVWLEAQYHAQLKIIHADASDVPAAGTK